jgi:hypothetical protein
MKNGCAPCPRLRVLVLVHVDAVDVGQLSDGGDGGLFGGLAGEKVGCAFGKNDSDRKVGILGERGDDEW